MKNRVKELRDAKHLTQTGLALKVGSTQQTISKIEREIGVPKLDLALIMADFFNVTLEYLDYMNWLAKAIGTNRNKKRKCNIRKTNFLISGANICKRNCHVK